MILTEKFEEMFEKYLFEEIGRVATWTGDTCRTDVPAVFDRICEGLPTNDDARSGVYINALHEARA